MLAEALVRAGVPVVDEKELLSAFGAVGIGTGAVLSSIPEG